MIQWISYPRSSAPTILMRQIVAVFQESEAEVGSRLHKKGSDAVLAVVAPKLEEIGFKVELGKKHDQKIRVPVLYGMNGAIDKSFDADAFHEIERFVLEVEAGRAYTNYQFLKDLFQACMMHNVDYFCVAVRNEYRDTKDFEKIRTFFDTLYASGRLSLPLQGILIVGY
ncbi:hypothetical protein [Deinococcus sp. QL22]|uniref:hypothetical protein n=1 Tax=Deinococcus sp. QL22 TaxID=2939437 RepID=UPI002017744C|nr:hypothetical protein [Deinococcus sp. QL22]UQN06518.1 hypothetical protein M1R55_00950 [Deinococcus sp. QL22]